MEQKKKREHKVFDKHPIIGSLVLAFFVYILANIVCVIINFPLTKFVPGYPMVGPVGVIAAFLLFNLFFCWWFRPDVESLIKGGNMKEGVRFIIVFIIYWILGEVVSVITEGTKLAIPSFTSVSTAIYAGFFEELVFRGMLIAPMLRRDQSRKSVYTALIVSSVVFGLIHGMNVIGGAPIDSSIMQVVTAALLGIIFGVAFLCTGNLWLGVLLHTVHDIIAFSNVGATSEAGIITKGVTISTWLDLAMCIAVAVYANMYIRKEPVMNDVIKLWRGKWREGA